MAGKGADNHATRCKVRRYDDDKNACDHLDKAYCRDPMHMLAQRSQLF